VKDNEIDLKLRRCDGGGLCRAEVHIHGCYSDQGDCNYPKAHDPLRRPQYTSKETT
jgi:hypothetical protein